MGQGVANDISNKECRQSDRSLFKEFGEYYLRCGCHNDQPR